jgi:hypothetical protein
VLSQRGSIVNNRHPIGHAARVALGTLAALALLTAATACATPTPLTSDQFAPGWQAHARALINMGPAPQLDRTKWFVPPILPTGRYVVVQRSGDKAEVIDGYQFEVKSGQVADIYLFLRAGQGNVEVVPLSDVPTMAKALGVGAVQ